jgi:antitoxin component of MazEF toxin-antitoxin module
VALVKRLTPVGNSQAVIVDQVVLRQLGWDSSTQVEFQVNGEHLILSPHRFAKDDEARAAGERIVQKRRPMLERLAKR